MLDSFVSFSQGWGHSSIRVGRDQIHDLRLLLHNPANARGPIETPGTPV